MRALSSTFSGSLLPLGFCKDYGRYIRGLWLIHFCSSTTMLDQVDDAAANLEEKAPLLRSSTESSVTAVADDMNTPDKDASPHSSSSPDDDEDEEKEKKSTDARIRTMDLGVWRVFYQDKPWSFLPGYETLRKFREIADGAPYVWRFMKEIWPIAPGYLVLWLLLNVWNSFQAALSLWVTAQLLETVRSTCPHETLC